MPVRHFDAIDLFIIQIDKYLASVTEHNDSAARAYPAADIPEQPMLEAERQVAERLMRVNNAGEVSAQALYHAQALVAGDPSVHDIMQRSAEEEGDHLRWCRQRLTELNGHASYLDPFWYIGSFAIGTAVGLAGDRFSLGFVAETERQVGIHLQQHLTRLPLGDARSRAVLQQMAEDEARHGATAMAGGGIELPQIVRTLMQLCSKVMTTTAYWI